MTDEIHKCLWNCIGPDASKQKENKAKSKFHWITLVKSNGSSRKLQIYEIFKFLIQHKWNELPWNSDKWTYQTNSSKCATRQW